MLQTNDGGEFEIVNGEPTMDDSPETSVKLSLFGGNKDDSGADGDARRQWWGNVDEADPQKRYRSETQALLRSLVPIPANLRRLEDAVVRDLAWMTENGTATFVAAAARMPARNTVEFTVSVEVDGRNFPITITKPWGTKA